MSDLTDILRRLAEIESRLARIESGNVYGSPPFLAPTLTCTCDHHKTAELSAGWYCPVHGQRL